MMDKQKKEYFDKLQNNLSFRYVQTDQRLEQINIKIRKSLETGLQMVQTNSKSIKKNIKQIYTKIQQKQRILTQQMDNFQIENLKKQRAISSVLLARKKNYISKQQLELYEIYRKQINHKLWKMQIEQKKIHEKNIKSRSQTELKWQRNLQKQKQQQQKEKLFIQQQRKFKVQQNLKKIEQKRKKRLEILNTSKRRIKTQSKLPKYIIKEKELEELNNKYEMQLRQRILMKRKNNRLKYNPQSIKKHQKQYDQRTKNKLFTRIIKMKTLEIEENHQELEKNFVLKGVKDHNKILKEMQIIERRKQFGKELKKIKINHSIQKHLQSEIAKDKAKNPFKYNFLKQKTLTDAQIYENFPDFKLYIDRKIIGNEYLNSAKRHSSSRNTRLKQTHRLKTSETKLVYQNYLQQIKPLLKKTKQNPNLIISQDKSKVYNNLMTKSTNHRKNMMKIIDKLNWDLKYNQVLKIQTQIDNQKLQSLKAKLDWMKLQEQDQKKP